MKEGIRDASLPRRSTDPGYGTVCAHLYLAARCVSRWRFIE